MVMRRLANLFKRRRQSGPDLRYLYEKNHVGKTFGISFETFQAAPWASLGSLPPELQALWERPHGLLLEQVGATRRWNGAMAAGCPCIGERGCQAPESVQNAGTASADISTACRHNFIMFVPRYANSIRRFVL